MTTIATEQQDIEHKKLLNFVVKGTPVATAAVIAAGCTYVALNDPESKTIFPQCGFYALTGYYCPGCGMTRALHNVLTGDIVRAFRFNALLVIGLPVLAYLFVWWITWAFTGKELPRIKINRKITLMIIAIAVFFIVGRNLPGDVAGFFALER